MSATGEGQASEGALQDGAVENMDMDTTKTAEDENKFQKAIAAWRNLDLTSLVSTLDTAASDLVVHQRDSLIQRRDLAQKTKDFRKLDDASKLGEIKSLLKAYQTFIDLLTNQSKSVSSAFLQVYSPLSEAPDPYPLLEASVDSLVVAEEVVPKLTAENQHLQKTIAKLTTQLEETEKQLDSERARRQSLEGGQESKIKEVEASWSAVLSEKQNNWESKERNLEEKVESQDRLLKELKASYEVSQRLDRNDEEGNGGRDNASAAELEIVNSELERTSLRLAEVEARNEQLRLQLAQSASQPGSAQKPTATEDDPAYLRLRSENTSLLRKLDSARFEKESEKGRWEGSLRTLERDVNALKRDRDALREKVAKLNDYEDVKRELDMLKSIEFATGDDDEDADDTNSGTEPATLHANGAAENGRNESLEQLLLARNKKLGNELTVLRVSHQDLQARLETLQEDLSSTNMELEKSRALSATLENDLLRVQQSSSGAFPSSAMSVAGTYSSRYPKSAFGGRRGGTSPTSSIISGFEPQQGQSSPNTLESLRAGEPVGGGSGILPMVTAQRDRFKKKISELETELQKTCQTVSSLRSEVASLQKDNLDLYEKTRYVSTYSRGQPTSSASAYSTSPNPSTIQMSSDPPSGLGIDRYRSAYEQNISPFAAFRGRESARALKRMSLPERIVFQITRMVLATRTSRNLFALYCVGLHLLVFIMLFWMGSADIEKRASNLGGAVGVGGAGSLANAHHGNWEQEGFQDAG
ncbi:hypothetical protein LTR50_003842 [Elasticomyces elasticus]|nr:hypothetical protein LTR50_003842 [Elasticomyces elasticus]